MCSSQQDFSVLRNTELRGTKYILRHLNLRARVPLLLALKRTYTDFVSRFSLKVNLTTQQLAFGFWLFAFGTGTTGIVSTARRKTPAHKALISDGRWESQLRRAMKGARRVVQ